MMPPDNGPDAPHGGRIRRQDEILELLYWLEGEGFAAGNATFAGMVRFLARAEAEVREALDALLARGDVWLEDVTYRLTEVGRREAARRFAEEFAPMLSQGHFECNDPNCDCQTDPAGPAACRGRHDHGGH